MLRQISITITPHLEEVILCDSLACQGCERLRSLPARKWEQTQAPVGLFFPEEGRGRGSG